MRDVNGALAAFMSFDTASLAKICN